MPWTQLLASRFDDTKPIHAGMMEYGIRGNLIQLKNNPGDTSTPPIINGPPTSSETSYNDVSCIYRPWKRRVGPGRRRSVRRLEWGFRAAITAGAGTALVRFWMGPRFIVPGATAPADFLTSESLSISGAAADYGPYTMAPTTTQTFQEETGYTLDDEAWPSMFVYEGAQMKTSAGATTATLYQWTFRWIE